MKPPVSDRAVPTWASQLFANLVQTSPSVVTEETVAGMVNDPSDAAAMIKRLVRLGWLRPVGVLGAWAFFPPGVDELSDPYIGLRAWRAVEPSARFALAGETAAWHLGYLPRRPAKVTVWIPSKRALPRGLEGQFHVVTTKFPEKVDEEQLGPTLAVLKKRRLDLTAWASRLPAFGPEALLVQMAQRPTSIVSWTELAGKVEEIVKDLDGRERLTFLLSASTDAAKQRAAYLAELSHAIFLAPALLPKKKLLPVDFGKKGVGVWSKATNVTDRIIVPLLRANEKG